MNLKSWQFSFNRLPDLPEALVQGRERAYLAWIFATKSKRTQAIEPAALDEYVRVFSEPDAVRASFEWHREAFNAGGLARAQARAAQRLAMQVLAPGGDQGVGDACARPSPPSATMCRAARSAKAADTSCPRAPRRPRQRHPRLLARDALRRAGGSGLREMSKGGLSPRPRALTRGVDES